MGISGIRRVRSELRPRQSQRSILENKTCICYRNRMNQFTINVRNGQLTFDGQIVSFPQFGSKRRKLQIHISSIDSVTIRKGRGLMGELRLVVKGRTERIVFQRRDNIRAELLVAELLKASANPESYTLPPKDYIPPPPKTHHQATQSTEKGEDSLVGNLNRLESLKLLGELKESGVLTEEEFAEEKKKILDTEE